MRTLARILSGSAAVALLAACAALTGLDRYSSGSAGADATADMGTSGDNGHHDATANFTTFPDGYDVVDAGAPTDDAQDGPASNVAEGGTCAGGLIACAGGCVDPSSVATCGGCTPCGDPAPYCAAVASTPGTYQCVQSCPSSASTLCTGSCVDAMTDPRNCGTCGNACSTSVAHARATCGGGTCQFACDKGHAACGGACVDTESDLNNCGGCGKVCPGADNANPVCVKSACALACNPGFTLCGGACVSLNSPSHCGSCANVCSSEAGSPVCAGAGGNYSCASGCPAATSLCSGSCVDPTGDVSNCKTCGNACPAVANGQAACASSACTFKCNGTLSACGSACVDTAKDNKNCGSCGHDCTALGQTCIAGSCVSACATCSMAMCASQLAAVTADAKATALANCAAAHLCNGDCCFCNNSHVCATTCLNYPGYDGGASGPCTAEVEMAAGFPSPSNCSTDGTALGIACRTASNSCGKANLLNQCQATNCQTSCNIPLCI